ncbi:MAG: ABC transporter ATP-binding protein [Propionibacteriaceae bacterium]|nr:ABC transporter ATP-binding protein [Propionibacteriaceae bacterium]
MSVLAISDLSLAIRADGEEFPILNGVNLEIEPGEIHGLAGESGSGKTITGLTVMGLEPRNSTVTGVVEVNGISVLDKSKTALNSIRGSVVGMIFQDPSTSLHPMLNIERQLTDHTRKHLKLGKKEAIAKAVEALGRVGIEDPKNALGRYPHEFSGGQRQRIAIASALACEPKLLIADEVTTALDVTVQAGILRLIRSLADEIGLAVLFVSHDLGVVSALTDQVSVMQNGAIVESGSRFDVFQNPQHGYTKALLASLPGAKGGLERREDLYCLDLMRDL